MISRVWHGWTSRDDADTYETLLRTNIIPGIEGKHIDGYRGFTLFRRAVGDRVEFVTTMLFDSIDQVRGFAGPSYETPVIHADAERVLTEYDTRAAHYDVLLSRGNGAKGSRAARMADAIERCVSGPMWHGPSLLEAVDGLTAAQAATHPIAGAHSIWELVLHITTWANAGRERLGGAPGNPGAEQNFPAVKKMDDASWKAAVVAMRKAYDDLAAAVRATPDDALLAMQPNRDHSTLTMLHGIIEHGTYHSGQVAMLRRAQGIEPAAS